ncbi:MAG: FAD-dependent oxidoreductase [Anaerolineales bacterium]
MSIDANGVVESFDKVLVTTSPNLMAKLSPDLPENYLKGLLELKSMGAVVMVLALKHQLSKDGYYWFNLPKEAGFPMLALVEHTNFMSKEHYGGDHIVYAGDYLELGHEYFSLSDEQLLERFLPAFKRINPEFSRDWVKKVWVTKTNYAQPVPLLNHSKNIPAIQNSCGRFVLRFDESGLPVGPRHELCRGDREAGGEIDAGRLKVGRFKRYCPFLCGEGSLILFG